jgi:hypothetical protein
LQRDRHQQQKQNTRPDFLPSFAQTMLLRAARDVLAESRMILANEMRSLDGKPEVVRYHE